MQHNTHRQKGNILRLFFGINSELNRNEKKRSEETQTRPYAKKEGEGEENANTARWL